MQFEMPTEPKNTALTMLAVIAAQTATQHLPQSTPEEKTTKRKEYNRVYNAKKRAKIRELETKQEQVNTLETLLENNMAFVEEMLQAKKRQIQGEEISQEVDIRDIVTKLILKKKQKKLSPKQQELVRDCLRWNTTFLDDIQFAVGSINTKISQGKPCFHSFQATLQVYANREWHDWFIIKMSTLHNAGFGLFAKRNFKKGDFLGTYMGQVLQKQQKSNHYTVAKSDSTRIAQYGIGIGTPIYFGLHFMNDPNYNTIRRNNHLNNTYNTQIEDNLTVIATQNIAEGDELFLDYAYK